MADLTDDHGDDREWLVNQIAHALRNPIFAASVQVEALLLRLDDREAVARSADSLHAQLERLSASIDEMLLFGRPITGHREDVRVSDILSSLAIRYRTGDRGEPAAMVDSPVDPNLAGRWDRAAVTIILERLLDNAVQHTPPPHVVELGAAATGDGEVTFTVSDFGDGIPEDILGRATLPFFPQHSGRPGLGLAVAEKFARYLGGRIEIESAEGRGTVARCVLPVDGGSSPGG
ncbi:MAG: HAMP domain-containing histidine kinase [Thermoanaerobaculales bacterium]|jgi:signal transduction histidine kinase|nr:HAMP domain-containing histidine kinase [Thermoanaerobaculales bacterium]